MVRKLKEGKNTKKKVSLQLHQVTIRIMLSSFILYIHSDFHGFCLKCTKVITSE